MKKSSVLFVASVVLLSLSVSALAQTATPPDVQPVPAPMHRQPGHDHRRQIEEGIHKIDHAYDHLAQAGDDWGGHREAAMKDLQNAKRELEAALEFESKHMHP